MIPVPVYCRHCGGFTGKTEMRDDCDYVRGKHENADDCIEHLREQIEELRSLLTPVQ